MCFFCQCYMCYGQQTHTDEFNRVNTLRQCSELQICAAIWGKVDFWWFLQIHLFTTDCEYLVHLYVKLSVCEVKSGIVQTQLRLCWVEPCSQKGSGLSFIGDNMEPDRLALWMQACHFGYYSYIMLYLPFETPKNTCRILKCSSTYPSINPLDTTNHSQTNLYPAMQQEANMAAVQAMPSLSSVISIGNG